MDRSFSEPRKHNSDNFIKIACLPNGILAFILCSTWEDVRKTCPACLHCGEFTWKCIHTVRITLLILLINFSALYALIVANGIVALQKSNKTAACLPSNQSQIMNCTKKKKISIRCSPCLVSWVIFMSCGLHLATVILKEFPAICIQLNFLTDLDLLINTEIWQRENLCCQGHFLKTITMGLAVCRFRKYAEGKKKKKVHSIFWMFWMDEATCPVISYCWWFNATFFLLSFFCPFGFFFSLLAECKPGYSGKPSSP